VDLSICSVDAPLCFKNMKPMSLGSSIDSVPYDQVVVEALEELKNLLNDDDRMPKRCRKVLPAKYRFQFPKRI
jgi:hypothetical protein